MAQKGSSQTIGLHSDVMSTILSQMADGIALFDEQHRLVYCNEQYHDFFSLTQDVRVPGAALQDILHAAVLCGEQLDTPENVPKWIERVLTSMRNGGEQEVRLWDGRSILLRTTAVPDLGAISVATDITKMRQNEIQLAAMAQSLETQASRDPLTKISNRRAFDRHLSEQLTRIKRSNDVLSLILVDVDYFKALNDHYGHVEGDKCLRQIAQALSGALNRPTDFVARFGGEEFCVLLPGVTEGGAVTVAKRLRDAIVLSNIAHIKSEYGHVTISAGVATCGSNWQCPSPAELIDRADKALYAAKAGGRNQVQRYTTLANVA